MQAKGKELNLLLPDKRRPIRMLMFTYEPFPTQRVDVEVLFGRELLGRGHEIDFVMQAATDAVPLGPQGWRGRTVWVGPTDTRDGFYHRLRKRILGVWHDLRSLRHALPARYDAIQVRDKYFIAAIALIVARRRGLKFFYWLSWPEPESQLMRAREGIARYPAFAYVSGVVCGWLLYKWILPRCDHAFVQSEQMKKDVAAHGIDALKLTPVPMGIAASEIPPHTNEPPPQDTRSTSVTVAYLGTLNAQRKPEVLLDMLSMLLERSVDARLLLVGDGDHPQERLRLEQHAKRLRIERHMEITGFLPRPDALARLQMVDICISPFFPTPVLLSTSPTKLVEYLALGLPVVANDHPEQRLILRASRAGVCVPWGAKHFARAVAWLARQSPSERRLMGSRGRRWILDHRTYERIADEVERTYLDLLAVKAASKR